MHMNAASLIHWFIAQCLCRCTAGQGIGAV